VPDRAGVDATRAVYVGDSRIDREAAESAGMHFIGVGSRIEHHRLIDTIAELLTALERRFGLAARQRDPLCADSRLWPGHRVTVWRLVKRVMVLCQIRGRRASPRGLRHAFGVNTLASGMPLNVVQRMLGHSSISTTTIYTQASGPEERAFVERFWRL